MRGINETGLELIKKFEGCRLSTYFDIVGILSIGIGHVCKPGEDFSAGITEQQALDLLQSDLRIAIRSVLKLITAPLTDNQLGALTSFTFNLGGGALQRSTLRRKINRGESPKGEWEKWCFAGGRKSIGLLRRRQAEAALYALD